MRSKYVAYVLCLITVLLFAANCDCRKDPIGPEHYWVICVGKNSPALTNGTDVITTSNKLNVSQWSCPDTTSSPVWIGSGTQTYSTTPYQFKTSGSARPRATGPGSAAYLPEPFLNLPFPAQASPTDSLSPACDPSQPDVIQVNHDNATVNRLSTCPFNFVATIPVAGHPLQIAITPDGKTALVTSFDNAINFIDLASNTVTFTLQTGALHPNGLAITPDGAFAYFTNFVPVGSASSISKVDLSTRAIVQTMPALAPYAQNLVLSPDGSQLYVTFPYSNYLQILDTLTNAQVAVFSLPAPRGIAFNGKGTKAYIAEAGNPDNATLGTVQELDTNTFTLGTTYNVGLGPNDIAVLYGDQYVVTTNYEGQSISKIDTVSGNVVTTQLTGPATGFMLVY